ncbi:MAG: ankyrin repeat domain-containing protein [Deltaproteobacteria bacterium]|nr:ankyrin repeat domain-containing protein [Deltaproteobacteria bacterium]
MTAAGRFAKALADSGITVDRALGILRERPRCEYAPEVVAKWLSGEIIPGLNARFYLLVRADLDDADRDFFAKAFVGRGPEEQWPLVDALCRAARDGNSDDVRLCLSGGVCIDAGDESRWCPIGYAAKRNDQETARLLLEYGAGAMAFTGGMSCAWHEALRHGEGALVRDFLQFGASPTSTDNNNRHAVEMAALNKHDDPDVLRAVYEAGNNSKAMLFRPLMHAIRAGHKRVIEYAIEAGAHVNNHDEHKVTPLMAAVENGSPAIVERLIETGVELNRQDEAGRTALHRAVEKRDHAVIKILMDAGASTTLADKEGLGALDRARKTHHETYLLMLNAKPKGPSWYQPGEPPIFFRYEKAFGLGFDPGNIDRPILYGGDYDGMMAAIPRYFLDQPWAAADLEKFRMGWFIEFIRKLTHREDFTLDELRAAAKANGVKPFSR